MFKKHSLKQRKNLTLKSMFYNQSFCEKLFLSYNNVMDTSRNEILIGKLGQEKIKSKNIAVVGVGGVGGYVATILARSGVEKMTLIDFDKVTSSNINRQVVALLGTIGKSKVEVLKNQLLEINDNMLIQAIDTKLNAENVASLIDESFDYVIDAIDSVSDKVSLICHCKKKNIKIISAMGAGNRMGVPRFYLTDIYKTHDDGLAKVMRKRLRAEGIDSLEVVTSEDKAVSVGTTVGSISYVPAMCGITIGAIVINKILNEKMEDL